MIQQRIKHILIGLFFVLGVGACTPFDELNTDPTKSDEIDPNMQLSYVQLATYGMVEPTNAIQSYASSLVQQFQGEYNKTYHGGKYRIVDQMIAIIWTDFYNKPIKNLVDVLHATADKPEQARLYAIARIYKVFLFSILTDLYGDIPYFDAGKGYLEQNFTPNYDTQEAIYRDFFKELTESVALLNTSADANPVTGDIIYDGDVEAWKRLANSLQLRYAMRVVKADPQLANAQVTAALSPARGGLISSSDQEAYISYLPDIFDWDVNEIRRNAQAQLYIGREPAPLPFLCSTFWNLLRDTQDPRLFRIGRTYWGEGNFTGLNAFDRIDITEEVLDRGGMAMFQPSDPGYFWYDRWPSGYWSNTLNIWVDKWTRPQLNEVFLKSDIPGIVMSYAETELLLAEAKVRWPGLATAHTAEEHYIQGVEAAMDMLAVRYKTTAIPTTERQTYWSAHAFPTDVQGQLKSINEQLWIVHITNPSEAYANWRRSGFPVLKSAKEYGAITIDSQTIPRRLPYPLFEKSYNPTNYQQAVSRMGGTDDWNARVWWDKN